MRGTAVFAGLDVVTLARVSKPRGRSPGCEVALGFGEQFAAGIATFFESRQGARRRRKRTTARSPNLGIYGEHRVDSRYRRHRRVQGCRGFMGLDVGRMEAFHGLIFLAGLRRSSSVEHHQKLVRDTVMSCKLEAPSRLAADVAGLKFRDRKTHV